MPPHFHHLIRWQDLMWCCLCPTSGSTTPVCLPTGPDCHKIHLRRRREELLVQHHSYLQEFVCYDAECYASSSPSQEISRSFMKGKVKYKVNFSEFHRTRTDQPVDDILLRLDSFFRSFFNALEEVGEADLNRHRNATDEGVLEQMIQDIQSAEDYTDVWWNSDCEIVYQLLVRNRPDLVLEGNRRGIYNLQEIFSTRPGGQAIGNGWEFLLHGILKVYLDTNLYIAALDDTLETKGFEFPWNSPFRLWDDVNARAFVHTWSFALQEGVYLKDMNATMDMLKGCFRFLANLYVVLDSCEPKPVNLSETLSYFFDSRCGKKDSSRLVLEYD